MSTEGSKPVHRIRLSNISAAIFENKTNEGKSYFNVQFDRSYKDGDEWKNTHNFGRDDLLQLAKVADQSHTWIYQQQQNKSEPEPE